MISPSNKKSFKSVPGAHDFSLHLSDCDRNSLRCRRQPGLAQVGEISIAGSIFAPIRPLDPELGA